MTVPTADPLDLALLRTVTDGDEALAREILALFLATARRAQNELGRHAVGSAGWQMAAHTLKGSAGNVGAGALVELAARAERARGPAEGAPLHQALAEALAAAEAFIAELR
jgi:HPt (histidine-containing phosphotransfer) domain-containing protein